MVIVQFMFENFLIIMAVILILIFANINKKKKFIKKAKKNGWIVEGEAVDRKYGHYSRSERQERNTCTVTYKYEVDGREYFIKKKYYSDSGPNVQTLSKTPVYYNPSNPKKAYV